MVYDKAYELASEIKASDEFKRFKEASEAIGEGMTKDLLKQYSQLRVKAQADLLAGDEKAESLEQLQKLGELLQMDKAASEYLMAEFMLGRMVGDVYRIIADAAQLDLSMLE